MSNIGKLQKQRKYREIHRFTRRDNFSSLSCATLLLSFQHVAIVGAFMEYVDKGFIGKQFQRNRANFVTKWFIKASY